jgi:hypothetical protein
MIDRAIENTIIDQLSSPEVFAYLDESMKTERFDREDKEEDEEEDEEEGEEEGDEEDTFGNEPDTTESSLVLSPPDPIDTCRSAMQMIPNTVSPREETIPENEKAENDTFVDVPSVTDAPPLHAGIKSLDTFDE